MTKKPDIVSRLEKSNGPDDQIKIRTRAKSAGGYTVYFDYYTKGKRELKYLDRKLHLIGTTQSQMEDKEKVKIIIAMRDQLQNDLLRSETGFSLIASNKQDFSIYFEYLARKKDKNWIAAYKHYTKFSQNEKVSFEKIDKKFCESFLAYLQKDLSAGTCKIFFQKFKSAIGQAIRDEIIIKNPAAGIVLKNVDTKREFLTEDELKRLAETSCYSRETRNAFLFSCFSGLRYGDIKALTFSNIQDGYLEFKQEKVKQHERFKLSKTALAIIAEQSEKRSGEKVFNLVYLTGIEKHLKDWTLAAGIDKHITFHCARHTFATLLISSGVDLYTVSKLLGHSDISTTQVYAKLIDKVRDEAIDKLPEL